MERRHQRVPLPDRHVRGLRLRPSLLRMMDLHPLWSRHVANLLAGQLQPRLFSDPKHFSDRINRLNAGRVSELIEKRIARNFDRFGQADVAVRVMFFIHPALEKMFAITDTTSAVVMRVGQIFP